MCEENVEEFNMLRSNFDVYTTHKKDTHCRDDSIIMTQKPSQAKNYLGDFFPTLRLTDAAVAVVTVES